MKGREHNDQTFEDTKGLIRRHKSMKDREHNAILAILFRPFGFVVPKDLEIMQLSIFFYIERT
jgi:hypothetical protein